MRERAELWTPELERCTRPQPLGELLVTEIKHPCVTYRQDRAIYALSHRLLTTHETVLAPLLNYNSWKELGWVLNLSPLDFRAHMIDNCPTWLVNFRETPPPHTHTLCNPPPFLLPRHPLWTFFWTGMGVADAVPREGPAFHFPVLAPLPVSSWNLPELRIGQECGRCVK